MNSHFNQKLFTAVAGVFLAARLFAAETNQWATPSTVTREEVANNYLHIQEQIHESQLSIEKKQQAVLENQQAALDAAKSNADALAARLQSLEDTVAKQRASDADAARKTQQTT